MNLVAMVRIILLPVVHCSRSRLHQRFLSYHDFTSVLEYDFLQVMNLAVMGRDDFHCCA